MRSWHVRTLPASVLRGLIDAHAAALRDQALAKLFFRSGWTQEELAKREGKSQRWISYRTLFGRFLGFSTSGSIPRNLTERRFRSYWERTEKGETNERIRFREVLKLMEAETTLRRPIRPVGELK